MVLTRQFRLPAYLAGHDDLLIEAAAGMLDDESPEERIRAEAEEEIGYRLHDVRKVFEAFMSPGAVTEKLHFFVAEYDASMRVGSGGGLADEGEDIEVLELPIDSALAMIIGRPHRGCQDHHAAAIRGAAYFQVRIRRVGKERRTCPPLHAEPVAFDETGGHAALCPPYKYTRFKTTSPARHPPAPPSPCAARPSSQASAPPPPAPRR